MVNAEPSRQSCERGVAAFDFDGTLTVSDSFAAFLRWHAGERRYAAGLLKLAPEFLAYAGRRDRGRLKAAAVRVFLAGMDRAELTAAAERFCAERFDALMRPDALATWRGHVLFGDERVIVTASPALLVQPFANRLEADRLLGTELAFDAEQRVRGAFAGENCRGEEKARRLRQVYGPGVRLAVAYGDTSGDREMLAMADRPHYRAFTERP